MSRLIFLDSAPLGLLAHPTGGEKAEACSRWAKELSYAGALIFVPEIVDYEVRRELLRIGQAGSIRRLDGLKSTLLYSPLNTGIMLRAAELRARARREGIATADDKAIDADVILAAQALDAAGLRDTVTIATTNVRHLARFVDAREWPTIR